MTDKIATVDGALGPLSGEALATEPGTGVTDVSAAGRTAAASGAEQVLPARASETAAVLSSTDGIAALAAALDAQRLDAAEVVELIVERSLEEVGAEQLSPAERAAVREQVLALVADDPHLSGLRVRLPGNTSGVGPDRGTRP